jgi:hypothetical protein
VVLAAETSHAHVHFGAGADNSGAGDSSIALADASVYLTPSTSLVAIASLDTPARAALSRSPTAETLDTADTGTADWDSDVEGPTPDAQLAAARIAGLTLDAARAHLRRARPAHAAADFARDAPLRALAAPVPAKPRRAAGAVRARARTRARCAGSCARCSTRSAARPAVDRPGPLPLSPPEAGEELGQGWGLLGLLPAPASSMPLY